MIHANVQFVLNGNEERGKLYQEAQEDRKEGEMQACLMKLFYINKYYLNANYDIADIYLNEYNNYDIALNFFNIIIEFYKSSDVDMVSKKDIDIYRKSLFMSSYIYANHLSLYTKAIKGYEIFMEKFPDDTAMLDIAIIKDSPST